MTMEQLDQAAIDAAARALEQGALVAFPTETVYGLGADAENPAAVAAIYAAKGRPQDHPVIVFSGRHISMLNTRALKAFGMWEATAKPPMGTTIHRDQGGVPTGLATEVFYFLPEFSVDQMKAAIRGQAKELFTDRGTTTIFTIPFSAQDVRADLELQRAGELPLRIRMFYHVPHMTSLEGLLNMLGGASDSDEDEDDY